MPSPTTLILTQSLLTPSLPSRLTLDSSGQSIINGQPVIIYAPPPHDVGDHNYGGGNYIPPTYPRSIPFAGYIYQYDSGGDHFAGSVGEVSPPSAITDTNAPGISGGSNGIVANRFPAYITVTVTEPDPSRLYNLQVLFAFWVDARIFPDGIGGEWLDYSQDYCLYVVAEGQNPPPPPVDTPVTPVGAWSLAEDAHGRPLALTSDRSPIFGVVSSTEGGATGVNGLVSNTAGKSYLVSGVSDTATGYFADDFGADNPCLLVDRRTNHFRAIYSLSETYIYGGQTQPRPPDQIVLASSLITDRFSAEITVLPGVSGGLCAAAQHPTDADYALMLYSDIGTSAAPGTHDLKCAFSTDAGATWKPLLVVLPGLDLTVTGRPALCWLGNTAILVYSTGAALFAMTSLDRGQTWTSSTVVSRDAVFTDAPGGQNPSSSDVHHFCLSLAAHEGQVYLLAFVGNTQQVMPGTRIPQQSSPYLFASGDGGQNWMLRGTLPGIKAPSGIGVSPASGLLRLDTQYVSADGGLSWTFPGKV